MVLALSNRLIGKDVESPMGSKTEAPARRSWVHPKHQWHAFRYRRSSQMRWDLWRLVALVGCSARLSLRPAAIQRDTQRGRGLSPSIRARASSMDYMCKVDENNKETVLVMLSVFIYIHIYLCLHVRMYVYIHIHIYTYIHIYICISFFCRRFWLVFSD